MAPITPPDTGRVEHVHALVLEGGGDPAHDRRRVRGEVGDDRPRIHPVDDAVGAQHHRLDLGRAGKRGQDQLGAARGGLRTVRPRRAALEMGLCRVAPHVVHDEGVAGLHEVQRHRPTHVAQSDESDLHRVLPRESRAIPSARKLRHATLARATEKESSSASPRPRELGARRTPCTVSAQPRAPNAAVAAAYRRASRRRNVGRARGTRDGSGGACASRRP